VAREMDGWMDGWIGIPDPSFISEPTKIADTISIYSYGIC
jgi:hypothetical protein